MSGRRGFLALVGGSFVSGGILRFRDTAQPTLVLPKAMPLAEPLAARPLLAEHACQMDALLAVGMRMPKAAFLDWLESGLGQALLYPAKDEAAENRRIQKAADEHGSIIAAMRAGALS